MANEPTATWLSQQFTVYTIGSVTWNDVAGVYIFATIDQNQCWKAIYVGKADSFKTRLPNHERHDEAARLMATHIHAMVVPLEANRDKLEQALIAAYQPPLNTHHR